LDKVREQLQATSAETDNVILTGDVNLDTSRRLDMRYRRRCLMLAYDTAVAEVNMRYLETGIKYRSHGLHVRDNGKAREHESVLNHMCVTKDLVTTVNVLNDSTMDHYPLLASVMIKMLPPANKSIVRRNFKKVTSSALNQALESWHRDWSDVFKIEHPDALLAFINKGIVHDMDLVALVKRITVKDGALPLYLRPNTLALMTLRDLLGCGPKYRSVRNRVSALVRRNKELSNLAKLAESNNSPTVLWEIANTAVGKPRQPLPGSVKDVEGNDTVENLEASNVVNSYYMEKGSDGIPVTILKMGSDVLAGPISHLVNMSLAACIVPEGFKTALIQPVYKGGGKSRKELASYRPVAILCAMLKVLETVAKEDLEAFMKANNILPASQHCFRKGHSCTTALATAHAAWVSANKSKVVAVIGFDLSAAFDTVGRAWRISCPRCQPSASGARR
jgi:hypothetical protein